MSFLNCKLYFFRITLWHIGADFVPRLDAWILGPSLSGSCGLSVKEVQLRSVVNVVNREALQLRRVQKVLRCQASRHPWTLGMAVLALEGHKKLEVAQQALHRKHGFKSIGEKWNQAATTVSGRTSI